MAFEINRAANLGDAKGNSATAASNGEHRCRERWPHLDSLVARKTRSDAPRPPDQKGAVLWKESLDSHLPRSGKIRHLRTSYIPMSGTSRRQDVSKRDDTCEMRSGERGHARHVSHPGHAADQRRSAVVRTEQALRLVAL